MAKFLTKDEELHLGTLVQKMVKAKEQLKADTDLSAAQKRELSAFVVEGEKAVEIMVKANSRLVYKKARSFKESYPGGPELEDIIQDGMAGLMNAILRYDPARNNKLSTVATYWIFQSISRQANKTGRLVRLPENRVSDFSKISRMRKKYEIEGMPAAEIDEYIMKELKLSAEDFRSIVNAAGVPASLNHTISDDESPRELIDIIPLGTEQSVESSVIKDAMRTVLNDAVENLTEVQRDVLNASFVFDTKNSAPLTTKEVKRKHKITTEAFNAHLAVALKEVKKEMDANGVSYDDFLDD